MTAPTMALRWEKSVNNDPAAKFRAIIQLNYDLAATALAAVDHDIDRAISILETAADTVRADRLPDMGTYTPEPGRVLTAG